MSDYSLTLAPGEQRLVNATGRYLFVAGATHDFELAINGGPFETFEDGSKYTNPERITRLDIRNPSAADDLTVALKVQDGAYDRSMAKIVRIEQGALAMAEPVDVLVGDVPVKIADANTDRVEITIRAGEEALYFGPSNAVAAGGVANRIEPGYSVNLYNRGEFWAVRDTGLSALCGILEEIN